MVLFVVEARVVGVEGDLLGLLAVLGADAELLGAVQDNGVKRRLNIPYAALVALTRLLERSEPSVTETRQNCEY